MSRCRWCGPGGSSSSLTFTLWHVHSGSHFLFVCFFSLFCGVCVHSVVDVTVSRGIWENNAVHLGGCGLFVLVKSVRNSITLLSCRFNITKVHTLLLIHAGSLHTFCLCSSPAPGSPSVLDAGNVRFNQWRRENSCCDKKYKNPRRSLNRFSV